MKVSELTKLTGLGPEDEILVVRSDVGPGLASKSEARAAFSAQSSVGDVVTEALDRAWPIGSYYKGEGDPPPIGEWNEIYGRYLYAMDSSDTAGSTGGQESVTLTVSNMPSHTHTHTLTASSGHVHSTASLSHTHTASTLVNHTHNTSATTHTHMIPSHIHTGLSHSHQYANVAAMANERTDIGSAPNNASNGFGGRVLFSGLYNSPSGSDTSTWAPPITGTTDVTLSSLDTSYSTVSSVDAATISFSNTTGTRLTSDTAYSTFSSVNTVAGYTNNAGSGAAHSNIPPTRICKVWRRVS